MHPELWGPSVWKALHLIALAYPRRPDDDDVYAYKTFFYALANVLPCGLCAANYLDHLIDVPIEPYLRQGKLFEWTVEIHNVVNRDTGKPEMRPSEAYAALKRSVEAPSPKKNDYRARFAEALRRVAKESPGLSRSERMREAHRIARA